MREFLIDLQDLFHSICIDGGRDDLTAVEARKLMRETAQRGIDALDRFNDAGEPVEV